ncbi:MAG: amidohydrolase family protein [Alphaproteobacteria bacterium]
MRKLLITNIDWVITVDRERRMIEDGAIAIAGDRIAAVARSASLAETFHADEVIDGRGLIALPGLIDASVATVQQLGRGAGDFCDAAKYRLERCLAYEGALASEDALWAARASQLEMIRAGTTCFLDSGSRFPGEIAAAAIESGLRAIVPRACGDVFDTAMGTFPVSVARETRDETLRHAESAIRQIRGLGHSRAQPALALPWMAACSDELCRDVAELARNSGVLVVADAGRTRDDAVASRIQHKRTEIGRLQAAGLLGHRTVVSHAGWTAPRDMAALAETRTHVACCPSMSHRLGSGSLEFGRYPELLEFGVNVALGSGSAMASNYLDIARQLFLFSGGNKAFRLDASVTPPETAVEMATIRGAAALGLEREIGSLEAGKHADIALFRALAADWVPLINPIANIVFSSRGGAHTVIVDGNVLLHDGELRTIDEERYLAECQARAEALMLSAGLARFCAPQWTIE